MAGTALVANPLVSQPAEWPRPIARPDRRNAESRAALLCRVIGEFREMPGLGLTLLQAARLFGLRPATCFRVLSHCVREGWLDCTPEGVYKLVEPSH